MSESGVFVLSPNELGKYGEKIAQKLLRERGFKVRPFSDLLYKKRPCSKAELLAEICSENCHLTHNIYGIEVPREKYRCRGILHTVIWWEGCVSTLYKFCHRVCKRFCRPRKIFQILKDSEAFGLDYVAYKNGKQYAVEVKTGKHKELKRSQRELAKRLKQEFGVGLIHIHIVLGNRLTYQAEIKFR